MSVISSIQRRSGKDTWERLVQGTKRGHRPSGVPGRAQSQGHAGSQATRGPRATPGHRPRRVPGPCGADSHAGTTRMGPGHAESREGWAVPAGVPASPASFRRSPWAGRAALVWCRLRRLPEGALHAGNPRTRRESGQGVPRAPQQPAGSLSSPSSPTSTLLPPESQEVRQHRSGHYTSYFRSVGITEREAVQRTVGVVTTPIHTGGFWGVMENVSKDAQLGRW